MDFAARLRTVLRWAACIGTALPGDYKEDAMTTHSRPAAIAPERPVQRTRGEPLLLRGNDPVDVYVRVSLCGAEFSVDRLHWYFDISWQCGSAEGDDAYALFITYHLPIATELEPSSTAAQTLWFSPVITRTIAGGSTTRTQLGYLPWVAAQTTFSFNVGLGDGTKLDPEIVITPVGGGDDGEGSTRRA